MRFYYNRWLYENNVLVTIWVVMCALTASIVGVHKDIQYIFAVIQLVNLLNLTFAIIEKWPRTKR